MSEILERLRSLLSDSVGWYRIASESFWWPLATWVGGLVVGTAAVMRAWAMVKQYWLQREAAIVAKVQDEDLRLHWFRGHDFVSAAKDYLVPYCSNVDPSDREDLRNTVAVREGVFNALDRELDAEDRRHILILADSGMGKTTLLLNLVAREQRRGSRRRRRMALVPLGEAGALDKVGAISNKRETVLLLDAFDEDPRAIEDAAARMAAIMSEAAAFKTVVLTCRTQFFPSDADLPRQTGIKRLAARRAGAPVVYQWLTAYLQPFDREQINEYVRRAIPWYRVSQRRKAQAIIGEISDLAARPMLTALIPSLAASKRTVHGLWDLYEFMVDTWIQRESTWIEASALRRISKIVAVELFLKRGTRGGERISRDKLIKLVGVEDSSLETWKLTSRSLLNRDADGFYKFAHRSVMEFFFISALLEGDQRCLSVKWTDMMCDLFLSWGSSAVADDAKATQLLLGDFRATYLFPVVERHEPSATLDGVWAKKVLANRDSVGARAKFPSSWRGAVAHIVERSSLLRAYDIADGLVWQVDVTVAIEDREERSIFYTDRYSRSGADGTGRAWTVVDLYELKLLCDILASREMLERTLDQRELYWIADTDGTYVAFARVRPGESGEAVDYPDLEHVYSGPAGGTAPYSIDVYRAATRGKAVGRLKAIAIFAHHGDAAALLMQDGKAGRHNTWGITREKALTLNTRRTY